MLKFNFVIILNSTIQQFMSTLRFDALKASMNRNPIKVDENSKRSLIFGTNVFGLLLCSHTYLNQPLQSY